MYYLYSWVYGLSSTHCRIKAAVCWGLTCASYGASLARNTLIPLTPHSNPRRWAVIASTWLLKERKMWSRKVIRWPPATKEPSPNSDLGFAQRTLGTAFQAEKEVWENNLEREGELVGSGAVMTPLPGKACETLNERIIEWEETVKWDGFHSYYEDSTSLYRSST